MSITRNIPINRLSEPRIRAEMRGEAVVVLGPDHDVFHAGRFRQRDPFVGVEIGGVESSRSLQVVADRNPRRVHDPFAIAPDGFAVPAHTLR